MNLYLFSFIIGLICGFLFGYFSCKYKQKGISVNGNCNQIIKNCSNSKITQIMSNKTIEIDA